MKNIITRTAGTCITVLLCFTGAFAQKDTLKGDFELRLDVRSGHTTLKGVTVNLYLNDQFISTFSSGRRSGLAIPLEKESYYILEVEKPGYQSKSILISTVTDKDSTDKTIFSHHLEIGLDKTGPDAEAQPIIGIIFFDLGKNNYKGSFMKNESPDRKAIITQLERWLGS